MENDTAGCPVTGRLWMRATTPAIAQRLEHYGIFVSARTAARILKAAGYALRVNQKTIASCSPLQRDRQFEKIAQLRSRNDGNPLISVDCKKKEPVGRFRNSGSKWGLKPEQVYDHDFRSLADGVAVPYGIYDLQANTGSFFVSRSYDTPQFAVDCIAGWWQTEGCRRYSDATEIVILADAGGSNSCRFRAWKYFLQHELADRFNLQVTVAHYPSGASKWNPIEHRLFSEVSKQWAGIVLECIDTILNCLRATTTKTGLSVTATYLETVYEKGIKISDEQMDALNCVRDELIPQWNYTIKPRKIEAEQ